jgi:hypothetical protein
MRYAAKNQTTDLLYRYRDFMPAESFIAAPVRDPVQFFQSTGGSGRYSDEQLYALALYIYSLKPSANPNKSNVLTSHGEQVFNREGCRTCHTPPLYTNNKLTIATGFVPQEELFQKVRRHAKVRWHGPGSGRPQAQARYRILQTAFAEGRLVSRSLRAQRMDRD